jgi:hypothetical protein
MKQFFVLSMFLFCYALLILNSFFFDVFVRKFASFLAFVIYLGYYFFLFKSFFSKKKFNLIPVLNDKCLAKIFDFFIVFFKNKYLNFFFSGNVWFI